MGQQVTKRAQALAHVYEDEDSVPEVEEAIVETEHQISVSREVVSTELSYVSSLETCIQVRDTPRRPRYTHVFVPIPCSTAFRSMPTVCAHTLDSVILFL